MHNKWKFFLNETKQEMINVAIPQDEAEILIDLGEKLEDDFNVDSFKSMAVSLTNYCNQYLKWSHPPKLFLRKDYNNSLNPLGKTAHYDLKNKAISIYTTGRHTKDILRSLAHELIHHHQNERGDLESCGPMGPGYAQNDDKLRDMEREAYEKGNMLFRDWEDSCKSKFLKETKNMKEKNIKISKKVLKDIVERLVNKRLEENSINEEESFLDNIGDDEGMSMEEDKSLEEDDCVNEEETEKVEEKQKPFCCGESGCGHPGDPKKQKKKSAKEGKIATPEQETALNEARFGNRNDKLFNKLSKLWAK